MKYCYRKRDERVAVHCSLFAVNFSVVDDFFFDENYFVFVDETTTPTQILRTVYSKKPVCETWQTPFILFAVRRFFVISPLFRCCSQIVYNGLYMVITFSTYCCNTPREHFICEYEWKVKDGYILTPYKKSIPYLISSQYSWLDKTTSYSARYGAGIKIWYLKNVELIYRKR